MLTLLKTASELERRLGSLDWVIASLGAVVQRQRQIESALQRGKSGFGSDLKRGVTSLVVRDDLLSCAFEVHQTKGLVRSQLLRRSGTKNVI